MKKLLPLILLTTGCGQLAVAEAPTAQAAEPVAAQAPDLGARLAAEGLRPEVYEVALRAHQQAVRKGETKSDVLALIDFGRPSTEERLWVVDLGSGEVLFHELVAHGKNSGGREATSFSNTPESLQSSMGVFVTAEEYHGKHGRSLRLDGLEPGVNDKARERAIVIHGADYVSDRVIAEQGRLGRSWGCPAVRQEVKDALMDAIGGGKVLVAYAPDADWLASSEYASATVAGR